MRGESAIRSDFKEKIMPHLESHLQFCLWLTRNGRDATRLMREALAELFQSFQKGMSADSCAVRLHEILTRRFLNDRQQTRRTPAPVAADNIDDSLIADNPHCFDTTAGVSQQSWPDTRDDDVVPYLEAIASLPSVCRAAMILSYVEGFSNTEIAELGRMRPHEVDSLLDRGRRFIRDELFSYLIGGDDHDASADREAVLA